MNYPELPDTSQEVKMADPIEQWNAFDDIYKEPVIGNVLAIVDELMDRKAKAESFGLSELATWYSKSIDATKTAARVLGWTG